MWQYWKGHCSSDVVLDAVLLLPRCAVSGSVHCILHTLVQVHYAVSGSSPPLLKTVAPIFQVYECILQYINGNSLLFFRFVSFCFVSCCCCFAIPESSPVGIYSHIARPNSFFGSGYARRQHSFTHFIISGRWLGEGIIY